MAGLWQKWESPWAERCPYPTPRTLVVVPFLTHEGPFSCPLPSLIYKTNALPFSPTSPFPAALCIEGKVGGRVPRNGFPPSLLSSRLGEVERRGLFLHRTLYRTEEQHTFLPSAKSVFRESPLIFTALHLFNAEKGGW